MGRERLLERGYWRKVAQIQDYFGFSDAVMSHLQRCEEVIRHLERVMQGWDRLQEGERLVYVSLSFNGILVYEEEVETGAFIDGIPRRPVKVDVIELLMNGKLALLLFQDQVIWKQLEKEKHQSLWEDLQRSKLWQQVIALI